MAAAPEILDLTEATVRRLIHQVNESGVEALQPAYGKGRPLALDWTKAEWEDLLAQAPAHFAKLETGAQNWTQQLRCQYLQEYHALTVSQRTVSSAIKRVGLNWRQSKLRVYSPDPLYVVKRQRVETLKPWPSKGN
jgi:transposase